jgi:hypothetical protein
VQRKGELLVDGEIVGAFEMDIWRGWLGSAAIENSNGGPRRVDRDGKAKKTTVPERDMSGEMVSWMHTWSLSGLR